MGEGLVPYLCCADAAAAIGFYTSVFGAVEIQRWTAADGRIGHAELSLGGEPLYLADEHPEIGVRGPRAVGGTPVSFVLSVPDANGTVAKAVAAGATVERPVTTQDDGARAGWVVDPFGHRWSLQTPVDQVPVEPVPVEPVPVEQVQVEPVPAEPMRDRVGDQYTITGVVRR